MSDRAWWLTTVRITDRDPRATDVKHLHDLVIQAALMGEHPRPVLWATPRPRLLIVRHDRPIPRGDWPPGWAIDVSHSPYWIPAAGDEITGAVVMDRSRHWRATERVRPDSWSPIREPGRMAELLTERLTGILGPLEVTVAGSWSLSGARKKESRTQWSNQTLLRFSGRVLDAPPLHELMAAGVGRNRSFGCGLILARPAVAVELAC